MPLRSKKKSDNIQGKCTFLPILVHCEMLHQDHQRRMVRCTSLVVSRSTARIELTIDMTATSEEETLLHCRDELEFAIRVCVIQIEYIDLAQSSCTNVHPSQP